MIGGAQRTQSAETFPVERAGGYQPLLDGRYLVDGLVPQHGVTLVYGHSGSGKSFVTSSIASAVAMGWEWDGRAVERGAVFYVVAEGTGGFRNRMAGARLAGDLTSDAPFFVIPSGMDLQAPGGDVHRLIRTIERAAGVHGVTVAAVVVDTLSKTFGAGSENTDDMTGYVANCEHVHEAFKCAVVVVHHRPLDSERKSPRGHSSLLAGVDAALLVEGSGSDPRTLTVIKNKEGEEGARVRFKLEVVTLGQDKRGDDVTTCVVRFIEGATDAGGDHINRAKRKLTGHARTALRVIEEVVAKEGVEPPIDIPPDAINRYKTGRAVQAGHVADRLAAELISLVDGAEDKKADTAQRTARRALRVLKERQVIGSWKDWLWVN
ncbi:MAG: helicase RepA family protein [Erythrobacteraceae bacterium]|nr:helicase RepA family protein [Erythrobacteraceae bacterium]